jgi:hypothetical protein
MLQPCFSPYPSRTAARWFLELLSTECPSVSVHQLGVDVATLWLRHGCPWSIGCRDPRSQKRDLGHPSRFFDTVRSGDHALQSYAYPVVKILTGRYPGVECRWVRLRSSHVEVRHRTHTI